MAHMFFNASAFTAPTAKPMPVILVLDNSGSMAGGKIETLNKAVQEMLEAFRRVDGVEVNFRVVIVTFGTGVHLFHAMSDVRSLIWQDLTVSTVESCRHLTGEWDDAQARGTPLGTTLDIVKSMIEDRNVIPSRAYRPAIILVSDGHPTDAWKESLRRFVQDGRSAKCDRWAMAIGRDADAEVLMKFIQDIKDETGQSRRLLYARDAHQLSDNFQFITMTVTNSVIIASKSKTMQVSPVTVQPTMLDSAAGLPKLRSEESHAQADCTEEEDSGFEW